MMSVQQRGPYSSLRAAVASFFERPLRDVPAFEHAQDWREEVNVWLREQRIPSRLFVFEATRVPTALSSCLILVFGVARGGYHCVIQQGDELVHDPHASGDGLERITHVGVFADLDACASQRNRDPFTRQPDTSLGARRLRLCDHCDAVHSSRVGGYATQFCSRTCADEARAAVRA